MTAQPDADADPARLLRFAGVGLVSTALYAALACWGTAQLHLAPSIASLLAYAAGAVFSYFGHRCITFRSRLPHRETSSRFAFFAVWGYAVALAAPLLLTDIGGLPAPVAVAFVSLAVPLLNFALLQRLVFARRLSPSSDGSIR
jgi:putative flippase GtrA